MCPWKEGWIDYEEVKEIPKTYKYFFIDNIWEHSESVPNYISSFELSTFIVHLLWLSVGKGWQEELMTSSSLQVSVIIAYHRHEPEQDIKIGRISDNTQNVQGRGLWTSSLLLYIPQLFLDFSSWFHCKIHKSRLHKVCMSVSCCFYYLGRKVAR